MKIQARDLYQFGLIDELIPEPLGGAHRDHDAAARALKAAILKHLDALAPLNIEERVQQRYDKFRKIGAFAVAE